MNFLNFLFSQPTEFQLQIGLALMRISLGILTVGHGIPKMFAGVQGWQNLGNTFMQPIGITFLPIMWGFLGAITEFVGGILLTFGLGTRIACFCLIIMMIIATVWHIQKGDDFMKYSFPLTLVFIFLGFLILGGGKYSLDSYLFT